MEINTKFNINQKVFYMEDNKVQTVTISIIEVKVSENSYIENIFEINYKTTKWMSEWKTFNESYLFWSKQELLNSL